MTLSMIHIFCLLGGIGLGIAFFAVLKMNSEMYIANGFSLAALALHIGRFAVVALVFWVASRFGAMPLLFNFGGFLIGRFIVMRFLNRKQE